MARLAIELRGEIHDVETGLKAEIQDVRLSIEQLRAEMQRQFNRQLVVLVTVISVAVGVVIQVG